MGLNRPSAEAMAEAAGSGGAIALSSADGPTTGSLLFPRRSRDPSISRTRRPPLVPLTARGMSKAGLSRLTTLRPESPALRGIAGRLVIATHNRGKLAEMRGLLAPYGIDATSAGELGLTEPEELGMTFRDNAHIKAEAAAKAAGLPAFADDSGLVVDALDGAPGIHSARWAGPERDFARAMRNDRGKTPRARRDGAGAPQGAFRLRAVRGLAGWSRRGIRGPRRRHAGLAAARRSRVLVTIRCSCRTATRAPSGKCRARKSTDCRRVDEVFPTARVPSSSWRRRALARGLRIPPRLHADEDQAFGVYVHWPFCLSKCPYCDFNSHVRHAAIDEARFVRAFSAEIAATAARVPGRSVSTIFFGGGTPSLMQPATVAAVLDAIARHWSVAADVEVTLEANPTSVEADALSRLSFGRRQPRLARRAGARRSRARRARAPAHGARGARRRRRSRAPSSSATRSI